MPQRGPQQGPCGWVQAHGSPVPPGLCTPWPDGPHERAGTAPRTELCTISSVTVGIMWVKISVLGWSFLAVGRPSLPGVQGNVVRMVGTSTRRADLLLSGPWPPHAVIQN